MNNTPKKAPERLRFAAIAVDIALLTVRDGELLVFLQPVNRPPQYKNVPGLPGGLIEISETADDAVVRHLETKVGIKGAYTEQLYTFSALERDKRNRVVSVAYLALVDPAVMESQDLAGEWVPVKKATGLAYDHDEILASALERVAGRLTYTNIAQYLLPKHFTLTELQTVYEVIGNTAYDKRNFRKKILSMDIVKDTGRMQEGVPNRPAALYTFIKKKIEVLPLFA